VNLDSAIALANIAAEATLLGTLLCRRVWRSFPIFLLYSLWSLAADLALTSIYRSFSSVYATAYLIDIAISSLIEFAVLIELARSVLRPYRGALPRAASIAIVAFILLVGACIWPFTGIPGLFGAPLEYRLFVRVQQESAILRVLFFLVLASCSKILSIGWRDRELQIATGLGFFSLVSMAIEMVHSHLALGSLYSHLNRIVIASFIVSLGYWSFSFARKEPERRPFTPQMQSFLVALAASARTARLAFSSSGQAKITDRKGP